MRLCCIFFDTDVLRNLPRWFGNDKKLYLLRRIRQERILNSNTTIIELLFIRLLLLLLYYCRTDDGVSILSRLLAARVSPLKRVYLV
jgi:hypothetical protein